MVRQSLHYDYLGEVELSDDEKRNLYRMIIEATQKHKDLIQGCIHEHQKDND